MRTAPSNWSLPMTRLPLPRNALVPAVSSVWPCGRSRSNIVTSRGAASGTDPAASAPCGRGRSLRSRSFPKSAIAGFRNARDDSDEPRPMGPPWKARLLTPRSGGLQARSRRLAEPIGEAVQLGVGVELDLDRSALAATADPDPGPKAAREVVGERAEMDVRRRRRTPRRRPTVRRLALSIVLAEPPGDDLARE